MYAAGDPAGALPPFNLSCQVRRWRSYICGELAAEVRLDCWGAAAPRSRNTEALLGFPGRLFSADLLTRFARLSFVPRVFRVLEDALWVSLNPTAAYLPNPPVSLFSSPLQTKRQRFCRVFFFFLRKNCRFVSAWSSFNCSQAHRCPPAIKRAWWCLQASGARPTCLSGTLHF